MQNLRQRPYHLVNAALNITRGTRLAWQERKAASFVASPMFCGYELKDDDRAGAGSYQRTEQFLADENEARASRRTRARTRRSGAPGDDPDPGALKLGLGTALAVSGAAASPNQGSHSAPAVAFLMTVFNVRLGWWLQNPAQLRQWRHMGPRWGIMYLLSELLGMADDSSKYVYLSDGGHFENLGIYELVRRRCRFIVACDAGMDPGFEFEDLGNAIRKCQVDLGVTIDLDTRPIRPDLSTQRGLVHCAVGTIRYGRADKQTAGGREAADGYLLYIKPSITGSEPSDVLQYRAAHAAFPHESTSDQWFGESQFESYRKLGHHITRLVFDAAGISAPRGPAAPARPGRERMFVALKERWYPSSAAVKAAFSRHADRLNTLKVALRRDESLRFLDAQIYPEWDELMRGREAPHRSSLSLPSSAREARAGFYFCINLLELMQSVYLDLNLEEEYDHPDNRGWMNLFKHWSWATMLRATYAICCSTFGARFQTFCGRRLDLAPGEPRVVSRAVSGPVGGILDEAHRRGELNFWEVKVIRECESRGVPFDEIHLLRLRVEDPSRSAADPDAEAALEFTFGFALTHQREFVYFRVQDHLRRMGLARDALLRLCRRGYTEVSHACPEGGRSGGMEPLPGAPDLGAERDRRAFGLPALGAYGGSDGPTITGRRAAAGTGPRGAPVLHLAFSGRRASVRERIGAQLEVHDDGLLALAAFHEPRRPVPAGRPQPAALPAGVRIVDAPVEPLGVEAQRVRHAQQDHLAVLERDQAVVEVGGRHRHVLAEPERVVLVDPGVVARLGAVLADALEARARVLVERPALRAVIAGGLRPVERPLALAPVEAADVAAAQRRPHDALLVDVGAADAEVRLRHVVDLRERGRRRIRSRSEPHDRRGAAEHADGAPDRAVDRARHHGVEAAGDALVLGRIDRLVGLDVVVALAVAVGVEDERRPPLRLAPRRPSRRTSCVLTQPTTGPPPLVHSVSLAS